jgi:hypothetical protein
MTSTYFRPLLVGAAMLALVGCNKAGSATQKSTAGDTTAAGAPSDPIKDAESAAPPSIAHEASVMAPQADGSMKTLRQGTNGWTCIPDDPNTPSDDPMCADANGMKWAAAWMAHKPPPPNNVGLVYMLKGASDASNTDPFATKPAPGSDWVKTGPHVMVLGADSLNKIYQASTAPDTTKPYLMFGGTPYAHLMVPIGG